MSLSTLQSAWFHKKVLRVSIETDVFLAKHKEQEWKSAIQFREALHGYKMRCISTRHFHLLQMQIYPFEDNQQYTNHTK